MKKHYRSDTIVGQINKQTNKLIVIETLGQCIQTFRVVTIEFNHYP